MEYLYLGITDNPEEKYISVEDLNLKKLNLSDEEKEKINSSLDNWEINIYKQWYHEDLSYNVTDKGESEKTVPVKDVVNMTGETSSDEIAGGYLVDSTGFIGVVVRFFSYNGYGMSGNTDFSYGILKTDGKNLGQTSDRSGHCSSEIDEWTYVSYTLKAKE